MTIGAAFKRLEDVAGRIKIPNWTTRSRPRLAQQLEVPLGVGATTHDRDDVVKPHDRDDVVKPHDRDDVVKL